MDFKQYVRQIQSLKNLPKSKKSLPKIKTEQNTTTQFNGNVNEIDQRNAPLPSKQPTRENIQKIKDKPKTNQICAISNPKIVQEDELDTKYDPDLIPPNFKIAQEHRNACINGEDDDSKQDQFCKCCARNINKKPLDLNCSIQEIAFLGSGYPLYFTFIKYCIYILTIILVSSGIFNMITSYFYGIDCVPIEDDVKEDQCEINWVTAISLEILNFASIILVIILLQIFRRRQRITDIECDVADIDSSDYSIMIRNIPTEIDADDYDEDLKNHLNENLWKNTDKHGGQTNKDKKANVVAVNLVYNLDEYYQIVQRKNDLIKLKQDALEYFYENNKFEDGFSMSNLEKQIKQVDIDSEELEKKFYEGKGKEFMKKYFTGVAFISFETEGGISQIYQQIQQQFKLEKEEILKYYNKRGLFHHHHYKYYNNILSFEQATKPTNVYWENFKYTSKQIRIRKMKGFIYNLLSLIFCLGIIVGLNLLKAQLQGENEKEGFEMEVLKFGISFVQSMLNFVLVILINKITIQEKHPTKTYHNMSLANRLSVAQFFNTALINFLIQIYLGQDKDPYGNVFGPRGLVVHQNFLFINNIFIPIAIDMIDSQYYSKTVQQKLQIQKDNQCVLTQSQLNQLFENPEFLIDVRYAQLLNLMYTIAFYTPILPIALVYSLLGLILNYWVDKFRILRRRTIKCALNKDLSVEMTENLEIILPIFSAANFFFFYYIQANISIFTIIGFAVGTIHAILPMQEFNEKVFKIHEPEPNELAYDEAKEEFDTDYAKENPATAANARLHFMEIEQDEQKEYLQKLAKIKTASKRMATLSQQTNTLEQFIKLQKDPSYNLASDDYRDSEAHLDTETNLIPSSKSRQKKDLNLEGMSPMSDISEKSMIRSLSKDQSQNMVSSSSKVQRSLPISKRATFTDFQDVIMETSQHSSSIKKYQGSKAKINQSLVSISESDEVQDVFKFDSQAIEDQKGKQSDQSSEQSRNENNQSKIKQDISQEMNSNQQQKAKEENSANSSQNQIESLKFIEED